jgi:hypothetical protein
VNLLTSVPPHAHLYVRTGQISALCPLVQVRFRGATNWQLLWSYRKLSAQTSPQVRPSVWKTPLAALFSPAPAGHAAMGQSGNTSSGCVALTIPVGGHIFIEAESRNPLEFSAGRLAQRLEHPVYTRKVQRSNR